MGSDSQRSPLSETPDRDPVNLPRFFAELRRRNVYKVGVAYAVVGWLLVQQVFWKPMNTYLRVLALSNEQGFNQSESFSSSARDPRF